MDYEAKINFCSIFTLIQCLAASRSTKKDTNSQWFFPSVITCFYGMGLFAMRSCHSHLVPTEPWDFDTSWNILWFLSAAKSSAPSQSEGNQSRRSQTSDSHLPAAARCLWFSRPVEKAGEREREENRERQTAEKRRNQKCHVPEAFISPNEMETVKGKHCFAFLKIVFPVE